MICYPKAIEPHTKIDELYVCISKNYFVKDIKSIKEPYLQAVSGLVHLSSLLIKKLLLVRYLLGHYWY